MERQKSPPPVRDTKKPRLKAPPGACDTHFHIYGPQARFPLNEARPLDVEDSTFDDVVKLHDTLGVARGVLRVDGQRGIQGRASTGTNARRPDPVASAVRGV